jgi:sugar-specific transcriptional regulator TrmB
MYSEILSELGLAKNEGFIYIALVRGGGMGIAAIALKSGVHRRNVYDSMQRLLERGLVYEEVGDRENKYFAVDPHKLLEMLDEKRNKVEALMPDLVKQFSSSASSQSVVIYRGIEGVKNYIRLMEREGKEIFLYGALGGSLSPKVVHTFERLLLMLEKKKAAANVLYKNSVITERPQVIGHLGKTSKNRILPIEFDDVSTYTVFGDYICFQSGEYTEENFAEKGEVTLFIMKSKGIADMMRLQFKAVWDLSKAVKAVGKK